MDISGKKILDVTCGGRSIWFNKNHPLAVYTDKREGQWERQFGKQYPGIRKVKVDPDVIADFRDLPFPDESFHLVVFDPPHAEDLSDKSWTKTMYGSLGSDWREMLRRGVDECMRVLVPYGTLIFKWAEVEFTTREVIDAIGREPLFGHHSGKKSTTHWLAFMKIPEEEIEDGQK